VSNKVDYSKSSVPSFYCCHNCKKRGVKLWRNYNHTEPILCAHCAGRDQGKDISGLDQNGMRPDELVGMSDQIGWFIPAVPTEDGNGFWGYTSVPKEGVIWWRRLPNA
jgi:hypothetical protein